MRFSRSGAAMIAVLACGVALRADLGKWIQHITGTSPLRAVFFRDVQLPGGVVPSRRPPRETLPALAKRGDLHVLRAREAELNLDFAQAEASWKAAGDPIALADYYHRRLDVPREIEALLAAKLFPRAIELARKQAVPQNVIYRAWLDAQPEQASVYESYADYLLANGSYAEAEALAAEYTMRFPADDVFPVRVRAAIAERRGSAVDALRIYDAAFRPLASPAFVARYFTLLERSRQLRAFVGRAREAADREPLALEPAVRLFYYHQQGGRLPEAHRSLLEYAASKNAARSQWTPQEQLTLARLFEATQSYAEAARYFNDAWRTHKSEDGLVGVIGVLFAAPEQELGIGGGDLTFYRDIATLDRYPGTLNGILSLLFNTTYPSQQFAEQEQAAVPYFHRVKAAELIGELERAFPHSDKREQLRAKLIQSYATYGANDAVIRLGREYLTAFPKSTERSTVALAMADAYARLNRTDDEFRIYDELLKELAAAANGVPLGSASEALPEIVEGDAPPPPPPGGPVRSQLYVQVLDRYLSRLVTMKRIKEALAVYRAEIDRNPNDPGLYERLAAFMAQNRMATSIAEVYQRAMRQFQDKSWHHKLARWYLRRQQRAAFEKVSREFISVFSGSDLEEYFSQVVASANLDVALYRELNRFAYQRFPHDLVFVRNLVSVYERKGTADPVAREALLRRHWYYDEGLRAHFFQTLQRTGRLDTELQSIEASKNAARAALQFLADGRAWQSHFEEAVAPADALAAQFPGDTDLNARSSSLFRSFGRTEEAVRAAERISRATPRNSEVFARLGDICAENERVSEAKTYWNRIPAIEPGTPEGYLEAATIYWDWFQYDDALRVIAAARNKLGNPALFAYEAGAIHENRRDYAAAVAEYLKEPKDRALRRLLRLAERRDTRSLVESAARGFDVRVAILEEQNRRDDLQSLLQTTLKSADSMERLQRVESIALNNGFPSVREAALQRQIELSPDPVERLRLQITLARLLEDRRDTNAAERVINAAYKSSPEVLGVVRAAVEFQWRTGRRDAAIETLQQSARRSNAAYRRGFLLEAARKATEAQQYAKARNILEPLLKAEPAASDLIAASADTWARAGDDRRLREFYATKLKEIRSADAQTALRRGLIPVLVRMKDYAGALDQYIEIARRYPEDDTLIREAAAHARKYGLGEQLVAWFVTAERDSPKDARWPMLLARVLTNLERPEQAIEAYTRASALRPDRPDLLVSRAELEDRLLRFEQSAATYARLYELTYRNPVWMVKAAESRARLGQPEQAVAALRKAFVEDRPPQPRDYIEAARRLLGWNLVQEAKQFADQAPSEDPALQQLLRVRLRQTDFRRAGALDGEPATAVDLYYTPEEKVTFAAELSKVADANLRLNVARSAGLYDVVAREMRAQLRRAPASAPDMSYAFVDVQQQRGQYTELAQELEALWKLAPPPTPNRDSLLVRAADNWRYAGNPSQELRVLQTLTQTSGNGEWLPRYLHLLARTAPQQLVSVAQAGTDAVRTSAVSTALAGNDASLALRAVAARGVGLPPVWTKAYTAITGFYFGSKAPEVTAAFDSALGPRTVAAQLATKFDRDQVLAGENWFYYAARYGEYLGSEEYLPAQAESRPASAQSYLELAHWLREQGKTTQALEEYRRALQIDSNLAAAHEHMAELLPGNEALTHRRTAFELWSAMQNGRLPVTFWTDVASAIESAGQAKQLTALRPQIDRLLRTYIRRTGSYRVRELLKALYRAAGPSEGLRWITDLSTAAPVPSDLLLTVVREDWIPANQREPLYREILRLAQAEVASKAGESRKDAEYRLRNARLQLAESLVQAKRFADAAASLPQADRDLRVTILGLQIAAHTGGLERWWERDPSGDTVQQAAAAMRARGEVTEARRLLDTWYRRQLDAGAFDAATFLGLSEILLEQNQTRDAAALLRRMVLLVPEPFESFRPAAELLERFKQPAEAHAFLEMRVRAVPWDASARTKLAAARNEPAALRTIAADSQNPYADRANAASRLSGVTGLGSQELDLLASGQAIQPAAAERPYFYYARLKAAESVQDRSIRTRLLRAALAMEPNDSGARLALFRSYLAAGNAAAAVGIFEPQLQNTLGEWLRQEDSEARPGSWVANGFLREHAERGTIAVELASAYRKLERLPAARTLLVIARDIDGASDVAAELSAVEAELARRAANRGRMPVINTGVEQTTPVRPKLAAAGGAQ